jgi:hypothetical protein
MTQQSVHPGQKAGIPEADQTPDYVSHPGHGGETENQISFDGGQMKTTTVSMQSQIGVNAYVTFVHDYGRPRMKLRPNRCSGAAGCGF